MAWFEDAAIDAAAEVFDEGAEQARIGSPDGEVTVQQDARGAHVGSSVKQSAAAQQGDTALLRGVGGLFG